MRRSTAVTLGTLFALVISTGSSAEPPGRRGELGGLWGKHRDRVPERFLAEHADALGLSEESRKAIQKAIDDSRERAEELRKGEREDREAMRELLDEAMPDEKKVMSLAKTMADRKYEMQKNRLGAMIEIRQLLTEEQREELVSIREGRKAGRRGRGPFRACSEDVAKVCSEAAPGQAMLQCLSEKWSDLSDDCRENLEGGRRRGFHRGRRGEEPAEVEE